MNAESAKQAGRLGTQEFYEYVENFHKKCLSGKKISAEDVHAFFDVISSTKHKTQNKDIANVTLAEPSIADKTSKILHQLQNTLGKNKAIIETATKTIPYQHIESALDSLTLYVDELKKKSKSVNRKDGDDMKNSHSGN